MRPVWPIIAALTLGAALPHDAAAQMAGEWKFCTGIAGVPWDTQISKCTLLIRAAKTDQSNRSVAYFNRGNAWRAKKNDSRAIADYDEAIRLGPNMPDMAAVYLGRGNYWRDKGELDRAVSDYNAALALDLKYAPAFNNRGLVWSARKEYGPAITDFDEAIRLDPKNAHAYINRGDAWRAKKDYDRAIADYSKALQLDPGDWFTLRDRAHSFLLAGRYDQAIAEYNTAAKIKPTAADGLYGRGVAKLRKGDKTGGQADIAAAKAIEADIAEQFARAEIKPD